MNTLTVYKASAGAGKTFQLALNYVTLMLSEKSEGEGKRTLYYPARDTRRYREILAITFTNKATEEMKARIINVLLEVSKLDVKSTYRDKLLERIECDAPTLAKAAASALTSLLFDFGDINISTIDSFFQSILRSFAYEADLSGNYDLELDDRQMLEMAIADTLAIATDFKTGSARDTGHSRYLRRWLHEFMESRMTIGKDITIFDSGSGMRKAISDFVTELSGERYQNNSDSIGEFLNRPQSVENLHRELKRKYESVSSAVAELARWLSMPENCATLNKTSVNSFFAKAINGDDREYTTANRMLIANPEAGAARIFTAKAKEADKLAVGPKLEEFLTLCGEQITLSVMLKQVHFLGLFSEVLKTAREMKIRQNTILLSDTGTLLHHIIGDSPTPFIYERIGQRLRNFLIDEFQDTSRLQWRNLQPLLAESLASGHDNLIIGDVKQCIYRFRNAEPGLLDHELEAEMGRYVVSPPLDTNYRSSACVVDFNSELFRRLGEATGNAGAYSTARQNAVKLDEPGYVCLSRVIGEEESLADMVANMKRQLDPAQGGYSPRDIVVLVRGRKEGDKVVERLMMESRADGELPGVKVLSDEALFVRNSRAVRYIIKNLRELNRIRRDDPQESELPEIEHRAVTTEREMDWITSRLGEINAAGIEGEEAIATMLKEFSDMGRRAPIDPEADRKWRENSRGRSLFEIVEKLTETLPDPAWAQEEALYISAFQDLVVEFCRSTSPSVGNFLALWDSRLEATAAVGLAAGIDAIRVMTIHKSKGLEFPCVHLPLLDMNMVREDSFRWYDASEAFKDLGVECDTPPFYPLQSSKELYGSRFQEEYKELLQESLFDSVNVLYVAFTRAVNELTVSMKKTSKANTPVNLLRPELEYMTEKTLDGDTWKCTFGDPTRKKQPKQTSGNAGEATTLFIPSYTTCARPDLWDFTDPAEEQE